MLDSLAHGGLHLGQAVQRDVEDRVARGVVARVELREREAAVDLPLLLSLDACGRMQCSIQVAALQPHNPQNNHAHQYVQSENREQVSNLTTGAGREAGGRDAGEDEREEIAANARAKAGS